MTTASRSEIEERLLRILKLEARRGYDDQSVLGGLDRFMGKFADRFPPDSPLLRSILDLPPRGYASLSPEARRQWVESAGNTRAEPASKKRTARASRANEDATPAVNPPSSAGGSGLNTPISRLSIRPQTVDKIQKIRRSDGPISTVGDLITHYPFRHVDYGRLTGVAELQPGDRTTVARLHSIDSPYGNRGRPLRAVLTDGYGRIEAVWFNQPWVTRQLKQGSEYVFSGKISVFNGRLQFESPEFEAANDEEIEEFIRRGRLVPVYPSTTGLPQRTLRRAVGLALKGYLDFVPELLPSPLREELELLPQQPAISSYHNPPTREDFEGAERRLGFDEFFVKQIVVLARRLAWQSGPPAPKLEARRGGGGLRPLATVRVDRRAEARTG